MFSFSFKGKKWNVFMMVACVIGLVMTVFLLREAYLNKDNFKTFYQIGWFVIFLGTGIANYLSYRKSTRAEG